MQIILSPLHFLPLLFNSSKCRTFGTFQSFLSKMSNSVCDEWELRTRDHHFLLYQINKTSVNHFDLSSLNVTARTVASRQFGFELIFTIIAISMISSGLRIKWDVKKFVYGKTIHCIMLLFVDFFFSSSCFHHLNSIPGQTQLLNKFLNSIEKAYKCQWILDNKTNHTQKTELLS